MRTRYLTLAIAMALTGCGGGGGPTTSPSSNANSNTATGSGSGTVTTARDGTTYPESLVVSSPFAVETTTTLGALAEDLPQLVNTLQARAGETAGKPTATPSPIPGYTAAVDHIKKVLHGEAELRAKPSYATTSRQPFCSATRATSIAMARHWPTRTIRMAPIRSRRPGSLTRRYPAATWASGRSRKVTARPAQQRS